ncbi:MAG: VWA domain-containing protein [Lentisphaeria bacterium]|nr:VWA domain-containing protein [Lentisphaeria bacterium]NLZ59259.1 VWA domain-containing protein [Lentisphaerota bacterium]
MKLSRYIVFSMSLSLLLHLLLLYLSADMLVDVSALQNKERQNAIATDFPITILPELPKTQTETQPEEKSPDMLAVDKEELRGSLQKESRQLANQRKIEDIFLKDDLLDIPKPSFKLQSREPEPSPLKPGGAELPRALSAPRPEIIEIDYAKLALPRQTLPSRIITPKLEREGSELPLLPSLAQHGPLQMPEGASFALSLQPGQRPKFALPEIDVEELKQAERKTKQPTPTTPTKPDLAPMLTPTRIESDMAQLPFDGFVDIEVRIVKDRVGNAGCFQVDILPNANSEALADIAKDTLFLIDHSTSISPAKLNRFKAATRESLARLNPRDRFNVVAFTTVSKSLFQNYQPVNPANLEEADKYIASLWRGGMTDVFGSIAPFVRDSNGNANRPLNIFVLTDGQSTVNIYEPPVFLRQINAVNPGNVSIFPFSAGRQANRQLLDFLGYLNRGSQCHVDQLEDLQDRLVNYISNHSSLIIMDLAYSAEGPVSRDIYPRSLPHLYRKESLRLYGRFANIEEELVLTLSGKDAELKRRSLIFRKKYRDCMVGGAELQREWAGQKILHLLAQRNYSVNQEQTQRLNQEINALAKKYAVYTPY